MQNTATIQHYDLPMGTKTLAQMAGFMAAAVVVLYLYTQFVYR